MIGQLLDSRYLIIRTLGRGGFGETYVAEDTKRPGRPICVLKHLKPVSAEADYIAIARRLFQAEAESLEKLGEYDRIPRLLAYFEENQEFYLVQEYVDGHVLSKEFATDLPWNQEQVLSFLEDVLKTLAFIHDKGVIHRDIKPENIIRRSLDQKFVLVDFGTVRQIVAPKAEVSTIIITGTPGYMPSEQAGGKPRPNSDLYTLGILAIQALTGLHPSQLQEDAETAELIWQPLVSCHAHVVAMINQMVRYHFRDRYAMADEILQDLIDFHEGRAPQNLRKSRRTEFRRLDLNRPLLNQSAQPRAAFSRSGPLYISQPRASQVGAEMTGTESAIASGNEPHPSNGSATGTATLDPAQLPQPFQKRQKRWLRSPILRSPIKGIVWLLMLSGVAIAGVIYLPQYHYSQEMLKQATSLYENGDLKEAVQFASKVPQDNFFYARAQGLIRRWRKEWNENEAAYNQAQQAASDYQWQATLDETAKLTTRYWQQKAEPMVDQAKQFLASPSQPWSDPTISQPSPLPKESFFDPVPPINEYQPPPEPSVPFNPVPAPKPQPDPKNPPQPDGSKPEGESNPPSGESPPATAPEPALDPSPSPEPTSDDNSPTSYDSAPNRSDSRAAERNRGTGMIGVSETRSDLAPH